MFSDYNDFLDLCEAHAEREFSAWVDADGDYEEPLDDETEGG